VITQELEMETRQLLRGFRRLPKPDQELLSYWFAPDAQTVEEVCRIIALNAPELIRDDIKQFGKAHRS
jgi:hypothetical protein